MLPELLCQRREDPAFDDKRLATAIATRDRSYKLLLWIGNAIDKGLIQFAGENGLDLDEQLAARIVSNQETRRPAAYLAYGDWLIRRLAGESDGPAILALWRIIAWDPRGGMRRGFELQLIDFKVAEETLVSAIRDAK